MHGRCCKSHHQNCGLKLKVKKLILKLRNIADRRATTGFRPYTLQPVYRQSFFCSAVLTPQHYHWYAATRFTLPGGWLAEWTTAVEEQNRPVSISPVISACWRLTHCEVKISAARIRTHDMDPKASVLTTTPVPQRLTTCGSAGLISTFSCTWPHSSPLKEVDRKI